MGASESRGPREPQNAPNELNKRDRGPVEQSCNANKNPENELGLVFAVEFEGVDKMGNWQGVEIRGEKCAKRTEFCRLAGAAWPRMCAFEGARGVMGG